MILINKTIDNTYIIKDKHQDTIEIQPKIKGGSTINITCINARGMVTNATNRHKMKAIETLTQEQQMMIYTETACTQQQQLWTCNDEHMVIEQNKV